MIINRHCSECRFQNTCRETAVADDNLTLLSGLTPKKQVQYQKKGIFTITQLSYQFRPRRGRAKRAKPTVHKPELQALALRTGKTYVVQEPKVIRSDTEIFLDIEGVPDRKFYYLAGLLVVSKGVATPHSFWANTPEDESKLWDKILEVIQRYPDAPIFHYGQYDLRACEVLAQRSGGDIGDLSERFINALSAIYGKIYFPTYGNGLKEIATHIGSQWPSELDSGLRSLVWRQRWEWTHDPRLKKQLLEYNLQDCHALRLITDRLSGIAEALETDTSLELADQPKKQATDTGEKLHQDFANILLLGHTRYSEKRIAFTKKITPKSQECTLPRRRRTNLLKPTRTVLVAPRRKCPNCKSPNIRIRANQLGKAIVADLLFTKNGTRKSITLYVGPKVYCRRCDLMFRPKRVCDAYHGGRYGDGLIAYVAYQRIALRLSLRTIASSLKELFGLEIPVATSNVFTTQLAADHASTERRIMECLLAAPCVHCDETKINIQGENHFAWVMTDGEHVIFRSTETREADWVKGFLDGYEGILVSDFYAGYDSIECRQQKCLSHLTRDMNEDLWKEPFNQELEIFAGGFKSLIIPIMETIQRYGSKKRNLNKHWNHVEQFYASFIDGVEHAHETTRKYQKRFQRYRDSLFTFLSEDGIPWNNNMAERALRHLAIQRKISGSFGKAGIHRYLRLLGVAQTCRFQEKSFLRFLLSGGKDVDAFDASRRKPKT